MNTLYNNMSKETIELIRDLNQQQRNTFLIPTRFLSGENAKLAFLLNEFYNKSRNEKNAKKFRSFFANSRFEALEGAIKLIRHNKNAVKNGKIIIYGNNKIQYFINPLNQCNIDEYLIPRIEYTDDIQKLNIDIKNDKNIVGIIIYDNQNSYTPRIINKIIRICKEKSIITVIDETDCDFKESFLIHEVQELPDIILLGETLTDNEIPFSVLSMTVDVHRPWTKFQTCLFHTSTYSGNKLAVLKAFEKIKKQLSLSSNSRIVGYLDLVDNNIEELINCFSTYINPGMIKFYELVGYDFICKRAKGSLLTIQTRDGKEKEIVDAVSGGGAVMRGHCPDDLFENVLATHDDSIDYWKQLSKKLKNLFGLDHVFPAVSGATAVEIAVITSLLASNNKKKILTFKNNFAGQTLISLIASVNPIYHKLFQPLYKNAVYIDPFEDNAIDKLRSELKNDDIALVWFEVIQGGTMNAIPHELIECIKEYHNRKKFYIGIDEILMGFYRTGELTSYSDIVPDIITFSKALADGTFPMAATLVNEEVYKKAKIKNSNIVNFFENIYLNQLGAHIGLNCITNLVENEEYIKNNCTILNNRLMELSEKSKYIKTIKGEGLIYQIVYKNPLLNTYFCKRALQKEGLFIYIDRVIPAVLIGNNEITELVNRLDSTINKLGNPIVFKVRSFLYCIEVIFKSLFY